MGERRSGKTEEDLANRISAAFGINVDTEANPCGLQAICFAFHEALQSLAAGKVARGAILSGFEDRVIGELSGLQAEFDPLLPAAPVQPPAPIRAAPSAVPPSPQPGQGTSVGAGTGTAQDDWGAQGAESLPPASYSVPPPAPGHGASTGLQSGLPSGPSASVPSGMAPGPSAGSVPPASSPGFGIGPPPGGPAPSNLPDGQQPAAYPPEFGEGWGQNPGSAYAPGVGSHDGPGGGPQPDSGGYASHPAPLSQPGAGGIGQPGSPNAAPGGSALGYGGVPGGIPQSGYEPGASGAMGVEGGGAGAGQTAHGEQIQVGTALPAQAGSASAGQPMPYGPGNYASAGAFTPAAAGTEVSRAWRAARNLVALRRQVQSHEQPLGAGTGSLGLAEFAGDSGQLAQLASLPPSLDAWSPGDSSALDLRSAIRTHLGEQAFSTGSPAGDVLDVVTGILNAILGDAFIRQEAKSRIGRLALPLLRTAFTEQSFLGAGGHPAREVVDRLGRLDLDYADEELGRALSARVDGVVERVITEHQLRPEVYGEVLPDLDEVLENQEGRLSAESRPTH